MPAVHKTFTATHLVISAKTDAEMVIDAGNLQGCSDKPVFIPEITGWMQEFRPGIGGKFSRNQFFRFCQDRGSGNFYGNIHFREWKLRKVSVSSVLVAVVFLEEEQAKKKYQYGQANQVFQWKCFHT